MDLNVKDIKLGVIGCGKMATAILSGVINNSFINNENIFVYDVDKNASENISKELGVLITDSIDDLLQICNVILLAVKPFVVNEVLEEIKKNYNNQLVLSILAGVKLEKYKKVIPNINIIRIMPNTPAMVNSAMSAVCGDENLDNGISFAISLMKNCGEVVVVPEEKIDIITALSGSGPAFYYKIIDFLAKSAQKLGLDYDTALQLSAQTALGSAEMLKRNSYNVEQLIKNVTTPGGCTEVGNNVLLESNIGEIFDILIKNTAKKAQELG